MKKPQLTNKKGTMQTHKKYQYLYLLEKLSVRDYRNDMFACELDDKRITFYYDWLNKINKQHLINNFSILQDGVSFNLDIDAIHELDNIDIDKFKVIK